MAPLVRALALALALAAAAPAAAAAAKGQRDLSFIHIPYNFGHTVERAALGGHDVSQTEFWLGTHLSMNGLITADDRNAMLHMLMRPEGGDLWGATYVKAQVRSNITGCPLYYTPGKYWPTELAEEYFGKKHIFGILRNPYERLSAMFRGSPGLADGGDYSDMQSYGTMNPKYFKSCDLDGAVFEVMTQLINGTLDKYAGECCWLQQAEYFDGPYAINVPVDNTLFPQSMNEIFRERGYPESFQIAQEDIFHVGGCDHVWAGHFKPATKKLIQQWFAKDFDLLCEHFGYCDREENVCLPLINNMCPAEVDFYPTSTK